MWKKEYIEKIGCSDVEKLQIEAAQAIKMANLPKFLYKYRPVNEFSLDNLKNDTVWLNKPSEYNDPFEFVEFLDFKKLQKLTANTIKEDIIKEFTDVSPVPKEVIDEARASEDPLAVMGKHHFLSRGLNEDQINSLFEGMDNIMKNHLIGANVQKIHKMQEAMKVCSFCEEHTQLLMWSHYADNHKGFCIEYNISKWKPNDIRNRILHPVIYQTEFYDVTEHLLSQVQKQTFNNLYPVISGSTKSKEWEYEKEWRFIFQIGDSFPTQNYSMSCQSKVFLGHRISLENKNKILDIAKEIHLPVFQSKPSKEKYKLEFELIST